MSPSPTPMSPQSRPMRTLIQRARRGSRFCISVRPAHPRAATSRPVVGRRRRRRSLGAHGEAADGDDALGLRGLHAEERARHDLDALRRLVARRFELEHALHFAQLRLLTARFAELVAELHVLAAQREMQDERRHRRRHGERPENEKRALRSHDATFLAARSLALRERGFCSVSPRDGDHRLLGEALPDRRLQKGALDQPVLERVKRDHRQDAARAEHARRQLEQRVELLDLVVHGDAQRLERARRRIDAAHPRRTDRAHHGAAQVERRRELPVPHGLLDAARDAARAPLFAVLVDEVGQLVGREPLDELEGRLVGCPPCACRGALRCESSCRAPGR